MLYMSEKSIIFVVQLKNNLKQIIYGTDNH